MRILRRGLGWTRQGLALAIGVVGGLAASTTGLPLPWMIGPMIFVTCSALAHAPIAPPVALRPFVIPVLGVLLGSGLNHETLAQAVRWLPTLAILPLFLSVAAFLSYRFYRRFGEHDPVTAYFCSMPGGLNDMLILGAAAGGDERKIALAHASRILVVVSLVGVFFGSVLGVSRQSGSSWVALGDPSLSDWAILAGCAIVGTLVAQWMRLSAAPILGPMILSGAAHVSGIVSIAPPTLLVMGAQLCIGTIVGARFLGTQVRDVGRDLVLAFGSSALMLVAALASALAVSRMAGLPMAQAFLGFSPGGLAEMGLLALAMGQDVAYVSVTHLVRIVLVIVFAKPIFDRLRMGRAGPR
ncbi:AbrB family transcriptional regulator [Wenxinia marina]|uniref:Membrane protein AbrB duplication n=1 Tax=Wenxinia marina DSM 24838 TaxID=1123501 RepID=A0A0D0Q9J7_9RHOB|nr:AbrB family transcriptional regulator [Wenxinia marina]KIQ71104.1 membrane protein AbrB duplication [Wenxinia marina DSM 24838]GGL54802.1 ammonia monooxygenase [Wenxinia marina]